MIDKNTLCSILDEMFPDATCELHYQNLYELLIAIILSAQTTDKKVNNVTPKLFEYYPTIEKLSKARLEDVIAILEPLGLANMKAKNILKTSQMIMEDYHGHIPDTKEKLVLLPGVGNKTANVFLAVGHHVNAFAVDTHVLRVANRLGISNSQDPLIVEADLMHYFASCDWIKLHHQFIFFGRYHCKARNPLCQKCKLKEYCLK